MTTEKSKYKTGPLDDIEKLAIKQLHSEGKTPKEMRDILNRSPKSKVVDVFLDEDCVVKYDHNAVLAKLAEAGLDGEEAISLISLALSKLNGEPTPTEVYREAIKQIGTRDMMIHNSDNGVNKNAVTVMTSEAAQQGSRVSHEASPENSRALRESVFRPKD